MEKGGGAAKAKKSGCRKKVCENDKGKTAFPGQGLAAVFPRLKALPLGSTFLLF